MSTFSFGILAAGDDALSVQVTDDGLMYAVDLVVALTGKDRNAAARDLRDLKPDLFSPENIVERKTPGTGNEHTKLISFKNAILLIMALPGKIAKKTRVQFADIIRTHLAAGPSSNAITQLARDSIINDPVDGNQEIPAGSQQPLKRPMESDGGLHDMDVDERKARIALMVADAHLKAADTHLKVHKELLESYVSICNHVDLDDEAKAVFKASVLNIVRPVAVSPAVPLLAAPSDFINISVVAAGMGLQFSSRELQSIGVLLKKAYVSKYKATPDQREQQVATGKIRVNSYTTRDLDLMRASISDFDMKRMAQPRLSFAGAAGPAAPVAGPV